jgi:hypothetical protein
LGKLQKETYKHFLENVIKPYVKYDKFTLILDPWGGQTNLALYDEKFLNENYEPTCSLKIILPNVHHYASLAKWTFTDKEIPTQQNFRIAWFSQQLIVSYLVGNSP